MKILVFLVSFLIHSLALGASSLELRVGDILLQPLDCWSCSLIEAEEDSIYSHMGVVVSESPVMVAEALGTVRLLPLEQFHSKTQKGQKLLVLRYRDLLIQEELLNHGEEFRLEYFRKFDGKKYDHDFLWENVDELGQEKIYCSELVTKLFLSFVNVAVPVKRMHFDKNRELWEKYFNGKVPAGEWGISPGDYERSDLFMKLGEL